MTVMHQYENRRVLKYFVLIIDLVNGLKIGIKKMNFVFFVKNKRRRKFNHFEKKKYVSH